MHLRASDGTFRIAIAVMFGESESVGQPHYRFGDILVKDMGQQNIGGYGAIVRHGAKFSTPRGALFTYRWRLFENFSLQQPQMVRQPLHLAEED